MNKALLIVTMSGIAAGLTSQAAFANAGDNTSTYCKPGFYAGIQGGRSDTHYNPSEVLAPAIADAQATNTTTTATQQVTLDGITYDGGIVTTTTSQIAGQHADDLGIGGRLYAGYQFNPYFAVELGYNQFAKTEVTAHGVNNSSTQGLFIFDDEEGFLFATASGSGQSTTPYEAAITEHAIDLVAKGTLPLDYGFGLYAKAGLAYITAHRYINKLPSTNSTYTITYQDLSGNTTTATTTTGGSGAINTIYTADYQAVRPVLGAGIDYTIPNTPVDVEVFYQQILGGGAIPSATLWGAGIAYKFA